jgi:hypothetical protein
MRKILILSVFLFLLNLIACGDVAFGGNPGEGRPCNENVLRTHAQSLKLEMSMNCPYEKNCDVILEFHVTGLPDSLEGMCFGNGSEWRFESLDTSMTVSTRLNRRYPVKLSQDDHLRFSLFDIQNIEKKYDLDLSGIVRSYTVRGDSVDVKVIKDCRITVISDPKNIEIYGNLYSGDVFTFSSLDSNEDEFWFGYDCLLHNQGPWEVDDLDVHAKIYWK